jgi:hypothetical protein
LFFLPGTAGASIHAITSLKKLSASFCEFSALLRPLPHIHFTEKKFPLPFATSAFRRAFAQQSDLVNTRGVQIDFPADKKRFPRNFCWICFGKG